MRCVHLLRHFYIPIDNKHYNLMFIKIVIFNIIYIYLFINALKAYVQRNGIEKKMIILIKKDTIQHNI